MPKALSNVLDSRWLFYLAAALPLVPVWTHPYLLTHDGTAHLASAKLILDMLRGTCEEATRLVEWSAAIPPNWTGHGLLVAMMAAGVPPMTAEKLLMSACLLGLAGAARRFCGIIAPGGKWLAYLALPAAWNYYTVGGLYNFSLSSIFAILFIGEWIRRQDDEGPAGAKWMAFVTLSCLAIFLSHPFGLILVAGFVGLGEAFALFKTRQPSRLWRNFWPFIPALVMCALLSADFARHVAQPQAPSYDWVTQVREFAGLLVGWVTYHYLPISAAGGLQWETLALTFWLAILSVALCFEGRKAGITTKPPLAWFIGLMLVVGGLLPNQSLGGWGVSGRFGIIVTMVWCAWLAGRHRVAPPVFKIVTVAVGIGTMGVLIAEHQQRTAYVSDIITHALPAPAVLESPNTILTLNLTPWGAVVKDGHALTMVPAVYAGHWLTLNSCAFDFNNYELNAGGVFPLVIKPEHLLTPVWTNVVLIEGVGQGNVFPYGDLDLNALPPERLPDHILVWGDGDEVVEGSVSQVIYSSYVEYGPFRARLEEALASRYEAVYQSSPPANQLTVYRRRRE